MIKDKNKSTGFVDFLNNEFQNKKSKNVISQPLKKQGIKKVVKVSSKKEKISKEADQGVVYKKKENAFGKKNNTKNRLANASKLIKTMEVFLEGKNDGEISYETFHDWDSIYEKMKKNISKDVDGLLKMKGNKKHRKTFVAILNRKLEHAPKGNILNYSVIVMSMLLLSFFSTTVFPNFTNKSVSFIDSLFEYPINKILSMNTASVNGVKDKVDKIKPESITREQLAEYIKKNSNKIKNNQTVPVEDIAGRVAGVEE